jgi:hypothetical protein
MKDTNAVSESSKKMMESGQKVLDDPTIPERLKKLVRNEMENQKQLMEAFGI